MKRFVFLAFVALAAFGTFRCFSKASEVFCPGVGATALATGQQCPPVDGGASDGGGGGGVGNDAGLDSGVDAGADAGDGG